MKSTVRISFFSLALTIVLWSVSLSLPIDIWFTNYNYSQLGIENHSGLCTTLEWNNCQVAIRVGQIILDHWNVSVWRAKRNKTISCKNISTSFIALFWRSKYCSKQVKLCHIYFHFCSPQYVDVGVVNNMRTVYIGFIVLRHVESHVQALFFI